MAFLALVHASRAAASRTAKQRCCEWPTMKPPSPSSISGPHTSLSAYHFTGGPRFSLFYALYRAAPQALDVSLPTVHDTPPSVLDATTETPTTVDATYGPYVE